MNFITKDQYQDFLSNKIQLIKRLIPLNKSNKWNFDGEINGISIHLMRNEGSGLNYIRTEGTISASIERIVEFISKRDLIPVWDSTVESVKLIDEHDDYFLEHYIMKEASPEIPKRDFIFMSAMKEEEDGSLYIYGGSYEINYNPPQENLIRASVPILGWRLMADSEDKNKTHFIYIDLIDFKDNIPKQFIDGESSEQAKAVKNLKDILESNLKFESL